MPKRRMISADVCFTDAFMDMPLSSQALYLHLNLNADDDGFCGNPKMICRSVGATVDDLKILIAKQFIISFSSGVIVVAHWRMHNSLRSDRYTPTVYQNEKSMLNEVGKVYILINDSALPSGNQAATTWQQLGNQAATQERLGQRRLDQVSVEENLTVSHDTVCRTKDVRRIVEAWNQLGLSQVAKVTSDSTRGKLLRARIRDYGIDGVIEAMQKIAESDFLRGQNKTGWIITFDWFLKPNNFVKVVGGNYDKRDAVMGNGRNSPMDDLMEIHEMFVEEENQ